MLEPIKPRGINVEENRRTRQKALEETTTHLQSPFSSSTGEDLDLQIRRTKLHDAGDREKQRKFALTKKREGDGNVNLGERARSAPAPQ